MNYRIEIHHQKKSLAFGNDRACGEFLQIWDTSDHTTPDSDNILVDEDRFTGFSHPKLATLLREHGFTINELEEAYHRQESERITGTIEEHLTGR